MVVPRQQTVEEDSAGLWTEGSRRMHLDDIIVIILDRILHPRIKPMVTFTLRTSKRGYSLEGAHIILQLL